MIKPNSSTQILKKYLKHKSKCGICKPASRIKDHCRRGQNLLFKYNPDGIH